MRSHYCGELGSAQVGEQVEICGWVHRRRDHGGVIFLDIRDRTGILQVVGSLIAAKYQPTWFRQGLPCLC